MKVLHVIPAVAPRYGGPSFAVVSMCRALGALGVETLVATTDADGDGRLPVPLGVVGQHESVPVLFFPRAFSEAFKYSGPLGAWLRSNVAGFDVVHIHAVFSHACLAAAAACRRSGVPYLVRPCGTLDPWSLRQKRWRKALVLQLGARGLLLAADALHYTSAEERRLTESALGLSKGVVIPLGLDDSAFELHGTECDDELGGDPYVLFLSRLHPKKNLELLLRAFANVLARTGGRFRLVVAGDGDPGYVRTLKAMAAELLPPDRVVFLGWVSGARKRAIFARASLLALPSRQENFGLAVVEAMASGVPVLVSTEVNVAGEVAAAGAGWVVPPELGALERALTEALGDDAVRRGRGRAGAELARRSFRWSGVASELLTLYRSLGTAAVRDGRGALQTAGS